MTPLLAEDLLLLLLDDEKGTARSSYTAAALGGALLAELALSGAAEIEEKTSFWRAPHVHVLTAEPLLDPELQRGMAVIAEKERSATALVQRLGSGLESRLAGRLAERGILEKREDRILGLFPRTTWPARDTRHEEELQAALAGALVTGTEPDDRTAVLIGLLSATGRLEPAFDRHGVPRSDIRRRAKEISRGDRATEAVRAVVAATTAAIVAAAGAGAAGAASS